MLNVAPMKSYTQLILVAYLKLNYNIMKICELTNNSTERGIIWFTNTCTEVY